MPRGAAHQIGQAADFIRGTERQFRKRLALDLLDAGLRGVSVARRTAPVDTGLLRRSISLYEKPTPDKLEAAFATQVRYGQYQEFGTARIRARHFFLNGVNEAGVTLRQRGWQGGQPPLGGQ